MNLLLYVLAVLTRVVAHLNFTDSPDSICCPMNISSLVSSEKNFTSGREKYRKLRPKADSPMLNYIFDSYAASNKHFHDKFRPPSFESGVDSDDTKLEVDTGAIVMLDCKVNSLRDKMVSWLKVSENDKLELLTVDLDTHTADGRVLSGRQSLPLLADGVSKAIPNEWPVLLRYRVDLSGDNWRLSLQGARMEDSGLYCCQVSTHPPMLRRVRLTVHAPELQLIKEVFLESGETLSLKCAVVHLKTGEKGGILRWHRGEDRISIDEVRGGVHIDTEQVALTSHLQMSELRPEDAGNYTCELESPIHMKATTRVHVLQGSSLAELQSGVHNASVYNSLLVSLLLVLWKMTVR